MFLRRGGTPPTRSLQHRFEVFTDLTAELATVRTADGQARAVIQFLNIVQSETNSGLVGRSLSAVPINAQGCADDRAGIDQAGVLDAHHTAGRSDHDRGRIVGTALQVQEALDLLRVTFPDDIGANRAADLTSLNHRGVLRPKE